MNKVRFLSMGLTLAAVLASCSTTQSGRVESLIRFPDHLGPNWKTSGKSATYTPETIFEYIDGEAEIYFPYGLKRASSQTYSDGKNVVVADVYEMGSLLDAFGIFSNYRSATARPYQAGAEGFADDYQIMFYKGPCFVRITAVGTPNDCAEALQSCAQQIDQNLKFESKAPSELDALAVEGINPQSIRYVARSVIGYPFFNRGFVAERMVNNGSVRVVVIPQPSEENAEAVLRAYADFLKKAGASFEYVSDKLTATDPMYKSVYFERFSNVVVGAVNLSDKELGVLAVQPIGQRAAQVFEKAG